MNFTSPVAPQQSTLPAPAANTTPMNTDYGAAAGGIWDTFKKIFTGGVNQPIPGSPDNVPGGSQSIDAGTKNQKNPYLVNREALLNGDIDIADAVKLPKITPIKIGNLDRLSPSEYKQVEELRAYRVHDYYSNGVLSAISKFNLNPEETNRLATLYKVNDDPRIQDYVYKGTSSPDTAPKADSTLFGTYHDKHGNANISQAQVPLLTSLGIFSQSLPDGPDKEIASAMRMNILGENNNEDLQKVLIVNKTNLKDWMTKFNQFTTNPGEAPGSYTPSVGTYNPSVGTYNKAPGSKTDLGTPESTGRPIQQNILDMAKAAFVSPDTTAEHKDMAQNILLNAGYTTDQINNLELQGPPSPTELQGPTQPVDLQGPTSPTELQGPPKPPLGGSLSSEYGNRLNTMANTAIPDAQQKMVDQLEKRREEIYNNITLWGDPRAADELKQINTALATYNKGVVNPKGVHLSVWEMKQADAKAKVDQITTKVDDILNDGKINAETASSWKFGLQSGDASTVETIVSKMASLGYIAQRDKEELLNSVNKDWGHVAPELFKKKEEILLETEANKQKQVDNLNIALQKTANRVDTIIDAWDDTKDGVPAYGGVMGTLKDKINWAGKLFNKDDPQLSAAQQAVQSNLLSIARSGGEKGAMSDTDLRRWEKNVPEVTDTPSMRAEKLNTLRNLAQQYVLPGFSAEKPSIVPAGVKGGALKPTKPATPFKPSGKTVKL